MNIGCFYRANDIARELDITTVDASKALTSLNKGGCIEIICKNGNSRVFETKQERLI